MASLLVNWRNMTFVPIFGSRNISWISPCRDSYKSSSSIAVKSLPQYVAFLDLETTGLIDTVRYKLSGDVCEKIPSILEIAIYVYDFNQFLESASLPEPVEKAVLVSKDVTVRVTSNKKSRFAANVRNNNKRAGVRAEQNNDILSDINFIEVFVDIAKRYEPLFVAHNGFSFDFKILIAYMHYFGNGLKDIKTFDSLAEVFRIDLKRKTNLLTLQNSDIFVYFLDDYKSKANLKQSEHTAAADCEMTALWCHQLRVVMDFANYISTDDLMTVYKNKKTTPIANRTIVEGKNDRTALQKLIREVFLEKTTN